MVSRGHIELFHAKTFFFIPPFPFFLFLNLSSWTGFYCRLKGGPFHVKSQSHNCYDYEVFAQQQPDSMSRNIRTNEPTSGSWRLCYKFALNNSPHTTSQPNSFFATTIWLEREKEIRFIIYKEAPVITI